MDWGLTAEEIAAEATMNAAYAEMEQTLAIARAATDSARRVWADVFNGEATAEERRAAWSNLEACKEAEDAARNLLAVEG